jgi:hypothetical protein
MLQLICNNCKQIQTEDEVWDEATGEEHCSYCYGDSFMEREIETDEEAEAAWDRQQERLMECGPDTSVQDRLDQQLRDAGRGHLVRK